MKEPSLHNAKGEKTTPSQAKRDNPLSRENTSTSSETSSRAQKKLLLIKSRHKSRSWRTISSIEKVSKTKDGGTIESDNRGYDGHSQSREKAQREKDTTQKEAGKLLKRRGNSPSPCGKKKG